MEGEYCAAVEKPPFARYQRCFLCPHDGGTCRLFTSSTTKNPGRQFYSCPTCGFFKWVDQVNVKEYVNVPFCGGCMAGVCRVRKVKSGPNASRILFLCRLKDGQGSCGYKVWQDEVQMSATGQIDESIASFQSNLTNGNDTGSVNIVLVEERKISGEVTEKESPVIGTSQPLQCLRVTSEQKDESKGQENNCEPSRACLERLWNEDVNGDETTLSSLAVQWSAPNAIAPATSIPSCSQTSLAMNSVSVKQHCWMAVAIQQNLSPQLQGWWGRLVFHPSPFLVIPALKPFIGSDSPPLEPIFVAQDENMVNYGASTTLTRRLLAVESYSQSIFTPECNAEPFGLKPFHVAPDVTLCINPFRETISGNVMNESISKAFRQAAEHLQNDLLNLLEAMDVKYHESMSQAAEATFASLDCLFFDHQDLKERVTELIHCAISLSETEQSLIGYESYQNLADQCYSKRKKLDKIHHAHAKAVDTVNNSKISLIALRDGIFCAKDWLLQFEAELSCREVEMRNMNYKLEKISKDKDILEGKYMIASKELEEFLNLHEQREAKHSIAKAAFDRAKMLLRR